MSTLEEYPTEKLDITLPQYQAYLVRLWRDTEQAPWRAAVTHVTTGEVHRFADPQLAWAYIRERLAAASPAGQPASQA